MLIDRNDPSSEDIPSSAPDGGADGAPGPTNDAEAESAPQTEAALVAESDGSAESGGSAESDGSAESAETSADAATESAENGASEGATASTAAAATDAESPSTSEGSAPTDTDVSAGADGSIEASAAPRAEDDANDRAIEPPAAPKKRRKKRHVLRWIGVTLLALLAALGGVIAVYHEQILKYLIQREALERGVKLDFRSAKLEGSVVVLTGARIALAGVRGIETTIESARISRAGLLSRDITYIEATSVSLRGEGSIADRALELGAWSKDHADLYLIPIATVDLRLEWRERAADAPWIVVSGASLTPIPDGVVLRTKIAEWSGVSIGPTYAAWTASSSLISLGFGKPSPADAPLRIDVRPKPLPATVDVTLRPVTMAALGSPLGFALPTDKATIEGNVKLVLGPRAADDAITGTASMTLRGWVPPHPRELGGVVFGDKTTFSTALRLSEDRARVTLSDATVTAGALKLKGAGSIDRKGDFATIAMEMKGSIPCSEVARSAASANFGQALGAIAGGLAQTVMEGGVGIVVRVDADTRDLEHARVKQDVGVGCGLRSLPSLLPKLPGLLIPGLPR